MATAGETSEQNGAEEVVRLAARHHDPDRYLAALLVPAAARPHLLAIAAFGGEVMHVPFAVSEPMLGRIRLQWWRDALARGLGGEPTGHPVADAAAAASVAGGLDRESLEGIIDAAEMLTETPAFRSEPELFAFLDRGEGALFAASARMLGVPASAALMEAARSAGRAHGIAGLLALVDWRRELRTALVPATLAARTTPGAAVAELASIASDARIEARAAVRRLAPAARPAFLPLATVRADRPGQSLSRLARIWRIGCAAALGRV